MAKTRPNYLITNKLKCNNNMLHLCCTCVTLRFTTDMIKKVVVEIGKRDVECLELRLFAFKTKKGIFTLSGTSSDGTDEWKHLETRTFHTWTREQVYHWFMQGKISPLDEANGIDWHTNTFKKEGPLKRVKSSKNKTTTILK